jgi:NTP pyrophosphatase (non-canonical NTP hydrolase)
VTLVTEEYYRKIRERQMSVHNKSTTVLKESQDMVVLTELIKMWHHDRNLIDGATDKDQFAKLIQEAGELSDNICKGNDIRDDIGDMMVVLINIAERNGITISECLKTAYNDIKDRKGKMVDGVFVKEADHPTYENTASGKTRY